MYADVDVKYMDASGDEIADISKILKQFESEIDSVKFILSKQSGFEKQISDLTEVGSLLSDNRYRLTVLSQALKNISGIYRRTEVAAEESFEASKPCYSDVAVGNCDYTVVGERTNRVLYGGEKNEFNTESRN